MTLFAPDEVNASISVSKAQYESFCICSLHFSSLIRYVLDYDLSAFVRICLFANQFEAFTPTKEIRNKHNP